MMTRSYLRKGMYPQPVYVATFHDGTVKRMTFFSIAGKPLDIERGRRLCQSLTSVQPHCRETRLAPLFHRAFVPGKQLVAGYVEIEGAVMAHDDFKTGPVKRKRGPTAKACLTALRALLENPSPEARQQAASLVAQAA